MDNIIFVTLLGIGAGVISKQIFDLILGTYKYHARLKRYPGLNPKASVVECTELHKWEITKLALRGIETGSHLVCVECGAIAGYSDKFLNSPAMEVLTNSRKMRDLRAEQTMVRRQLFQNLKDESMNKLIKEHIPLLNDSMVNNIEVMQQFYRKTYMDFDEIGKQVFPEDGGNG